MRFVTILPAIAATAHAAEKIGERWIIGTLAANLAPKLARAPEISLIDGRIVTAWAAGAAA